MKVLNHTGAINSGIVGDVIKWITKVKTNQQVDDETFQRKFFYIYVNYKD